MTSQKDESLMSIILNAQPTEERQKQHIRMPAKCFNTTSGTSLTCRIHPVVILTILDSYVRRPEGASRSIGTLLGYVSDGNNLDIIDCYTVIHNEAAGEGVSVMDVKMDQDYHRAMCKLKQTKSKKEGVVGWWSTGTAIPDSSVIYHTWYWGKDSNFVATQSLPSPVHLLVSTDVTAPELAIKTFVMQRSEPIADLVSFHEIPREIRAFAPERAGLAMLQRAQRETDAEVAKEMGETASKSEGEHSMEGFQGAVSNLVSLLKTAQAYVRDVRAGKRTGDPEVGRALTKALCSECFNNVEEFEGLCGNGMHDTLMVVYLSHLTQAQIALAEKITEQVKITQDKDKDASP
mmetsp:Transcript_72275/g.192679  ORF Transcript_72275/g.192679 Transcript_72275/m.192679 type:complete len:348 (-) Transcript_72275:106-1149(-)